MEYVQTSDAPAAIGPYSQAVVAGDLIYCSGQIALDPQSGALTGATAAEQARQVLSNLAAVLEAGGSGLDLVVKTTIYLKEYNQFIIAIDGYLAYYRLSFGQIAD